MQTNREWLSISDMMAGLMMVFLFIAIAFMLQVNREKETLVNARVQLNTALRNEFRDNLKDWGAEILDDNTIGFNKPNVLFHQNSSKITPEFQKILNDFFPRYLEILTRDKFKKFISELRIEGHTSSEWNGETPPGWEKYSLMEKAYLYNAYLSQLRAFSVLNYLFTLKPSRDHQKWLVKKFRATGLSFAKRIMKDGKEEKEKSRRVEFKVIINTGEATNQSLKTSKTKKAKPL